MHENVEEVRAKALIVVVFSKEFGNVDGLVLRQLGRTGNVQEQPTQLGEWRFLVTAARGVVVAASRVSTVVAAVVVIVTVCALALVLSCEDDQRQSTKKAR